MGQSIKRQKAIVFAMLIIGFGSFGTVVFANTEALQKISHPIEDTLSAQAGPITHTSASATVEKEQDVWTAQDRVLGSGNAARRPNIVFVLLDDVRFDDIVGHPFVKLPNIEGLISDGMTFSSFFTSAPLCSPSRAVFLTGQYPYRNGIFDNGERAEQSHQIVTFPRLLHETGYRTGFFGKWHMGHHDDTARPGFDRWVSFIGQGTYFDPTLNVDGVTVQETGYMTDILTEYAVSFIESNPNNQPFVTFIAQKASHPEVHPHQIRNFPPAPGDEELYEGASLPRLPSWRAPVDDKPALARPVDFSDPRSPVGGLPDSIVLDRLRMLSAVDRSIGRLRSVLSERGLLEDTIFVLTSDQGFFYGEFGLSQERRLAYDPSISIPLIISYPRLVQARQTSNALLSNVDIAPTLLELAGAHIPGNLDGMSFVQALKNADAKIRDSLLIEYYSDTEFPRLQSMGYQAIRTERYKYIRYRELEAMDELYDLGHDRFEMRNILNEESSKKILGQLDIQLGELTRSVDYGGQ